MKRLIYLFMLLFVWSCQMDDSLEEVEKEGTVPQIENQEFVEPESEKVYSLVSQGYPIEAQKKDDSTYVYQGDILIPKRNISIEGSAEGQPVIDDLNKAVVITGNRWTNNTIYFDFDPFLTARALRQAKEAMYWISSSSHLKFVQRTTESNYIYFQNGSGCSSYIGMIGGRQAITLGVTSCGVGSTAHEILHAAGFWHEQMRNDRDQYVTVLWSNIRSGYQHNFRTLNDMGISGMNLTDEYDFNSIMNYSSYAFSNNGNPTIVKKDGSTFTSNRDYLSEGDESALAYMYPEIKPEPTYIDGNYYTISGITVYRLDSKWYYLSQYGWREVIQRDGVWYYARTNVLPPSLPEHYENGNYYDIFGLSVYRLDDRWFYKSQYGWREVYLRTGKWYYLRTTEPLPEGLPN